MKKPVRRIAIALVGYFACWVAAHLMVMLSRGDGPSFAQLLPYFKYGWSFSGGELPTFILVVSLGLYGIFLAGWYIFSRRRSHAAA